MHNLLYVEEYQQRKDLSRYSVGKYLLNAPTCILLMFMHVHVQLTLQSLYKEYQVVTTIDTGCPVSMLQPYNGNLLQPGLLYLVTTWAASCYNLVSKAIISL